MMEEYDRIVALRAKFAAAMANPLPGKRPILKLIKPHFKRPPFNRTHKILRRKHRKKDPNPDHYNVPVGSYYALRWVKDDKPVDPEPGIIVAPEQLEIPPVLPEENGNKAPPPSPASGPSSPLRKRPQLAVENNLPAASGPERADSPEIFINLPSIPQFIIKSPFPSRSPTPEEMPHKPPPASARTTTNSSSDDGYDDPVWSDESQSEVPEQEGEVIFAGNSQSLPPQESAPSKPYNPFENPNAVALMKAKSELGHMRFLARKEREKEARLPIVPTPQEIRDIKFIDRRNLIDSMPTKLYMQDLSDFLPDAKKAFTLTDSVYKLPDLTQNINDDDLAPPKKKKN